MVALMIETFKTDKITAISVEARSAGEAQDKSSGGCESQTEHSGRH